MTRKLLLFLHTLIHLRPIQIRYQIWYRLRKLWRKTTRFTYRLSIPKYGHPLEFTPWIEKNTSLYHSAFSFLNRLKKFENGNINWNESEFGKLWTYNLNYMDFLLQPGMDVETGTKLIQDFIKKLNQKSVGIEPYPIALRGINWIKFLSKSYEMGNTVKQTESNSSINAFLYAHYNILLNNLEYHLMGNHLLEDGFSLLFGAFYFKNILFYEKAKEIIDIELTEQILADGAHFELSPMYHQIILDRLLDCINLIQNNQSFKNQDILLMLMRTKAEKMLIWLNAITFSNGDIPLLNDSAPGIAPTTEQLNKYAHRLNLNPGSSNPESGINNLDTELRKFDLSSSGYRRFKTQKYECIVDIGQIGPTYQPGHAHADTFNFVLNLNNESFIIDSGISTYEANETRLKERGTEAHNTVTVYGKNSSEVWSSFRVASKAKVNIISETKNKIIAKHNGYRKISTIHQRSWTFGGQEIEITDNLYGKNRNGKAHFWFAAAAKPVLENNVVRLEDAQIIFSQNNNIKLLKVSIPNGYNHHLESHKIEVSFNGQLTTTIKIC